jgi:hypothetical protein
VYYSTVEKCNVVEHNFITVLTYFSMEQSTS